MKRLIVLCDGTGQSSHRGDKGGFPTNVKTFGDCLTQTIQEKKGPPRTQEVSQIIYYQSGVGTSDALAVSDWLSEGVGLGIEDNILDAYYFLCNNYEEKDEICIFGFSRGAFTARIVANLVVSLGLLHMNVSWMIRRAWSQYKRNDGGFKHFLSQLDTDEYKKRTRHVRVKVLGVWDTVCAVSNQQMYDTRLHWGIENVFHALALDEYRTAFGPTLFYRPDEGMKHEWMRELERETEVQEVPVNLKQCWFAGSHTDIGGGYASSHQSNITLAWMIDNCKKRDLLDFNVRGMKWEKLINGHHRPQDDKYGSHIRDERNKQRVEDTYPGWGCGVIRDSYAEFLHGIGSAGRWQYRAPGNYATNKGKEQQHPGDWGVGFDVKSAASWLNPLSHLQGKKEPETVPTCDSPMCRHLMWDEPGSTNETIHATVYKRFEAQVKSGSPMKMMQWNPKSLELFRKNNTGKANVDFNREEFTHKDGYKFKWTGFCILHKDKKFEMWEEPDDDYTGGLMEQLRKHDVDRWKIPNPKVPASKYDSWLSKGFELKEFNKDPINYKPPGDRDDEGMVQKVKSYIPFLA